MIWFQFKLSTPNKGAFHKGIQTAVARGINEGGDKVRTATQKALKEQTGVSKYSTITSRMKESGRGFNRAAPGKLHYTIAATGSGLPIKEFPAKVTRAGVTARPWGIDHLFKRSFGITGRGVAGLRARLGPERLPIRRLYGPALPKELAKDRTLETFYASAKSNVPAAVAKHLLKGG